MNKKIYYKLIVLLVLFAVFTNAGGQNAVGIGTPNPNAKAILDLSASDKVLLIPRLNTSQMTDISSPPLGSLIFNTTLSSPMAFTRMGFRPSSFLIGQFVSNNDWWPVSPGPKVLAWGILDSSTGPENSSEAVVADIRSGSGNFLVQWYGKTNNKKWYELTLLNDSYDLDSMILVVTPIGNGGWDVSVSIGEISVSNSVRATIKFIDLSRTASGWADIDRRRRSKFQFVLYDLRGY